MKGWALLLGLGASAALAAESKLVPWQSLPTEERAKLMAQWQDEPLPKRLLEASERFLNVPYVFSPLGEGEGKDPDPKIRFDAMDCLSLVEETLAISMARTPDQIEPLLTRLRYGPSVSYAGRNHLMEAQWLPHAKELGFVRDVTREYGGGATVETKTVMTASTWRSPSSKALDLPPERQAQGVFSFPIIPLEKVLFHMKKVPSGTLVVVVRDPRPFKVTRMTHLGFVVQAGRTFLRHASKSRHHRVVDEELSEFLARNAKYDKWPVTGVALYEVLEPAGLISELSPKELPPPPPVRLRPETLAPAPPLPK